MFGSHAQPGVKETGVLLGAVRTCPPSMTGTVWPFGPMLRFSTTVSTEYPSLLEMPPPRQTIASPRQNHDLRPTSVDELILSPIPIAASPSRRAPPVQVLPLPRPEPSERGRVSIVVPGMRYLFAVGQYWFAQCPA